MPALPAHLGVRLVTFDREEGKEEVAKGLLVSGFATSHLVHTNLLRLSLASATPPYCNQQSPRL